jgi:3-isopropylmalate dehydrogenase
MTLIRRIAVLPGDGIGPEVTREAIRVLETVGAVRGHRFELSWRNVGGAAVAESGEPLPKATLDLCLASDAVFMGAVGLSATDRVEPSKRPERALLILRRELQTYANLRPVRHMPALDDATPLRPEIAAGTDFMIVRELSGGLYYGQPRGISGERPNRKAVDTLEYTEQEIERVVRFAFEIARTRHGRLTSVDKANVLQTSVLWRDVVDRIDPEYPDVTVEHLYVDNCAMRLVTRPSSFDVIVTENTFGDILSDEGSVLTGSLGMLPSASIGKGVALYEPVHGSAPDIAGRGIANPIASVLSVAMMLRYSLGLPEEAAAIDTAVERVLARGLRTADLARRGGPTVSTKVMGDALVAEVEAVLAGEPATAQPQAS